MAYYLGLDVRAPEITVVLVDSENFEISQARTLRRPVDSHSNPLSIFSLCEATIARVAEKAGSIKVLGVGACFPGPFEYQDGICRNSSAQGQFEQLFGVNCRLSLRHALGADKPVVFLNEGLGVALGEFAKGGARGFQRPVVAHLDSRLDASFLKDGMPQYAGDGVPEGGDLGSVPFRDGTGNDFFSSQRLISDWTRLTGKKITDCRDIAEAARQGNQTAIQIFADFGKDLAEFFGPWLSRFGADAFVIGGNLVEGWDFFAPMLQKELKKIAPDTEISVKPCELGSKSLMYGLAFAQTRMLPREPAPYARIPSVAQLIEQIGTSKRVQLDGWEKFPWKSLISELDNELRAKGKKVIWYEAASASDGRGGIDPQLARNLVPDPSAELCVVYGQGASDIPWEGALSLTV